MQSVAFTLFPMVAIADPVAVPPLMPEAWSTGAHLLANAHGLATGLMIREPQAATAASYDSDRGAVLVPDVSRLESLVYGLADRPRVPAARGAAGAVRKSTE